MENSSTELIPYRKGEKWGFCTSDKKIVIDCIYDGAACFSEGLARVELFKEEKIHEMVWDEDGRSGEVSDDFATSLVSKFGFIDNNNKEIVPCSYENAHYFSEGLAAVQFRGEWGFINKDGEMKINCQYDKVWNFTNGLALVIFQDKWAGDGDDGKPALLLGGEEYSFIDKNDEKKIAFKGKYGEQTYYYVREFSDNLAAVSNDDGKYGFIYKSGQIAIPCTYDDVNDFSEGLAAVKLNDKWGFIDSANTQQILYKYDNAEKFRQGLAAIKLNEKYGFIDKMEMQKIPCKYDNAKSFSEDLAAVEINGKWGYIDNTGKEIISCIYEEATDFKNGLAKVKLTGVLSHLSHGNEGYIDKKGTQFWEIDADRLAILQAEADVKTSQFERATANPELAKLFA